MATTQDKITGSTIEYVESQDPEKKPIKGVDDALQFAAEHGSDEWSEEEERKVLRKIDYRLIPLVSDICSRVLPRRKAAFNLSFRCFSLAL